MFVKQIDMKEALRLAHKDHEVKILVPSPDGDWEDMYPTTLQSMLEGCLFFRRVEAMVNSEFERAFQAAEAVMPTPVPVIEDEPLPTPAEPSPPPPHVDGADPVAAGGTQEPAGGRVGASAKRQKVDTGKLLALHKAGWTNVKIGEELKISGVTVGNYLKKLEEKQK